MSHDAETPKQQDAEASKPQSAKARDLLEVSLGMLRIARELLEAAPTNWPGAATVVPALAQLHGTANLLRSEPIVNAVDAWDQASALPASVPTDARQIELITDLLGALSLIADVPQMDHPVIPDDMVAFRMCETAVTFGQLRTARRVLWAGRAYLAEWHRQQQESQPQ